MEEAVVYAGSIALISTILFPKTIGMFVVTCIYHVTTIALPVLLGAYYITNAYQQLEIPLVIKEILNVSSVEEVLDHPMTKMTFGYFTMIGFIWNYRWYSSVFSTFIQLGIVLTPLFFIMMVLYWIQNHHLSDIRDYFI